MIRVAPITKAAARQFVREHHRHNRELPAQEILRASLKDSDGAVVGVALGGIPTGPALDDGATLEITRVCTLGERNACTKLYGAIRSAGRALGWRRFVTYTRVDEDGTSVKAAGFRKVAKVHGRQHNTGNRGGRWLPGLEKQTNEVIDRWRWEYP